MEDDMKRYTTMAFGIAALMMIANGAWARHPPRGMGPGFGHGPGFGPGPRCGGLLIHAPAEVIKGKLGLNDAQLARIEALRDNFLHKRIKLHAEAQQQGLKLRREMQRETPDQRKALQLMRKRRHARGVIAEERLKARLGMLRLLSKEQRAKLDEQCAKAGKRWGRRGRRGKRGWGPGVPGSGWGPGGHGGGWGRGGPNGPGGGPAQ
jgi:Spy/CpxP family protein refolding chaperone